MEEGSISFPSSRLNAAIMATAAEEEPPKALLGGDEDSISMCTPSALKKPAQANISPMGWLNGASSTLNSALSNPLEEIFTLPRQKEERVTEVLRSRAMLTVDGFTRFRGR